MNWDKIFADAWAEWKYRPRLVVRDLTKSSRWDGLCHLLRGMR